MSEAINNTNGKEIYTSNGKLLLTGEYVVLDGACALALPTKYGQSLTIEKNLDNKIIWKSFDHQESIWFEDEFQIMNNNVVATQQLNDISKTAIHILNSAKKLNPKFLLENQGYNIKNTIDFPNNWGLGSSSTLINNIAKWANVDAYKLLELTFGGSGYDIACAQYDMAITYQIKHSERFIKPVNFNPDFRKHLYFVYLNKKQNSREGIAQYIQNRGIVSQEITEINNITSKILVCNVLTEFSKLIDSHEQIIASLIKRKPVKELLFSDFEGSIKSLGAWGGDFVLVASQKDCKRYFNKKGFDIIIPYDQMILQ